MNRFAQRHPSSSFWAWLLLSGLLQVSLAWAQRTDVVVLSNGDRITGEVKGMNFGQLRLKTDDAGTVFIKWNKIRQLEAKATFEIELQDGTVYFGSIGRGSLPSRLQIRTERGPVEVFRFNVVEVVPIKQTFWARVDGSVGLGFSFTKASSIARWNLNADATYRSRYEDVSFSLSSTFTTQKDRDPAEDHTANVSYTRLLKRRWLAGISTALQRNSELGLDLRTSLGVGGGRYLTQTNQDRLYAMASLVVNREFARSGSESKNNLESLARVGYALFIHDKPKTDITATLSVFPNLTTLGRIRTDFEGKASRELFKDFSLGMSAYFRSDNQPPGKESASVDYGFTINIEYTY